MGLFSFSISFSIKYEKVMLQISQDNLFKLDPGELKMDFSHNIRKKQPREKNIGTSMQSYFQDHHKLFSKSWKKSNRLEIHIRSNENILGFKYLMLFSI